MNKAVNPDWDRPPPPLYRNVAEAVLNDLPAKLIRTYDRNTYAAEKRDALERWANHLAVAIAQASRANVARLPSNKTA